MRASARSSAAFTSWTQGWRPAGWARSIAATHSDRRSGGDQDRAARIRAGPDDPVAVSQEASILNHLSHDAIVRYHVFTIDPSIGRPYLAMEFVDGPSLFDIMRDGPVPADQVSRLCHRLASGLSAAHHAGTVHRDLSPDNIILPGGNVDRAKIIDFGIARSANVGGETLIGGRFAGKYNYVSPNSSASLAAT
jgi:serine/threonine protein kinase